MKMYQFIPIIYLPIILLINSISFSSSHSFIHLRNIGHATDANEFKTFYYKETLDHFNYRSESFIQFDQKYMINFKFWGGPSSNAPIFVYFGAEEAIDMEYHKIGFMNDLGAIFRALLVYIEHRYYGESVPFGSRDEAFKNSSTLGYFNSAQALADYADVIIYIQESLKAKNSPVVVIGGSYGGMLAAWFRLKYPHLVIGALASSAPILFIDDMIQPNAYMDLVSKDFKDVSESCFQTIKSSWSEIERVASLPNGISILSKEFNTCRPLNHYSELSSFLEDMYSTAAQYDKPPNYPVNLICKGIDEAGLEKSILDKIYVGMVANLGDKTCKVNFPTPTDSSETDEGWEWQACSEMVMPYGKGKNSMFPPSSFNLTSYIERCKEEYGVSPRPHWISTYYGDLNVTRVLQKFGSNIIFSNGLKDPYSSGGILQDLSESIVALTTINGSHCLDLQTSQPTDPEWLTQQRKNEVDIIEKWIVEFHTNSSGPVNSNSQRCIMEFQITFSGFLLTMTFMFVFLP